MPFGSTKHMGDGWANICTMCKCPNKYVGIAQVLTFDQNGYMQRKVYYMLMIEIKIWNIAWNLCLWAAKICETLKS